MKKILMVLCSMLLSVSLNVNAQCVANKVLSSLTFEAPKALYHAKGQKANMRLSLMQKQGWLMLMVASLLSGEDFLWKIWAIIQTGLQLR